MRIRRDPPEWDSPTHVCSRCSNPITPGTASQIAGRAVHLRCLAGKTLLESFEQQHQAGLERRCAQAAMARAETLVDTVRVVRPSCPVCGERLSTSRGVLFQGDHLVHAACWRANPKPFDDPPPAE